MQIRESLNGTLDFKLNGGHCIANCGVGEDWITVYFIETEKDYRNQDECQRLLEKLKSVAKKQNKDFVIWYPMDEKIAYIANKLNIKVYK